MTGPVMVYPLFSLIIAEFTIQVKKILGGDRSGDRSGGKEMGCHGAAARH